MTQQTGYWGQQIESVLLDVLDGFWNSGLGGTAMVGPVGGNMPAANTAVNPWNVTASNPFLSWFLRTAPPLTLVRHNNTTGGGGSGWFAPSWPVAETLPVADLLLPFRRKFVFDSVMQVAQGAGVFPVAMEHGISNSVTTAGIATNINGRGWVLDPASGVYLLRRRNSAAAPLVMTTLFAPPSVFVPTRWRFEFEEGDVAKFRIFCNGALFYEEIGAPGVSLLAPTASVPTSGYGPVIVTEGGGGATQHQWNYYRGRLRILALP